MRPRFETNVMRKAEVTDHQSPLWMTSSHLRAAPYLAVKRGAPICATPLWKWGRYRHEMGQSI